MGEPIIIQGTAVPNPATTTANANVYDHGENNNALSRSEKQETGCNDPIFAVLFYGCVAAVAAVAGIYGPDAFQSLSTDGTDNNNNNGSTTTNYDYSGYLTITAILTFLSFFGAAFGMGLMMCIPQFLIKASLLFVTILAGVWCALAFLGGNIVGGVIGAIFFAISICYCCAVWSRIPFATINLITACRAIRKHITVTFFAYLFAIVGAAWILMWSIAFLGLLNKTYTCKEITTNGVTQQVCTNPNYGILFGLFLALFFGEQVIQNSIHVCIAGTVGSWWFEPEDARVGCCDGNVFSSFIRTVTTSFGSICFGSFLVALVEALEALAQSARENGDAAIFACIAQCILGCLQSILEYFNKWAFIYVGLYGMPYLKAGKSVFELFANRGWEAFIADDLIGNTLFLVSIVVGGIMGAIGIIIDVSSDLLDDAGGNSKGIAFGLGFVVGLIITSILMSTIGSAVNAVIVLFAEAPNEFQQNHPELSQRMREIWNEVYPGSV